MNKQFFFRFIICFFVSGLLLYFYINKQNHLMKLRLQNHSLWSEYRQIEQETIILGFLIDKLENPDHLMQIADQPEYSYLSYPQKDMIYILPKEF